jgi:DNA-binding MarR family transcriptional regulator
MFSNSQSILPQTTQERNKQFSPQQQTIALLDHLGRDGKFQFIWAYEGKRSQWMEVGKPRQLRKDWRKRKNLFFGVNPSCESRQAHEASTNATIAAANCLYAEFDGKDETNPTTAEIDTQLELLRATPDNADKSDKALHKEALSMAKDAKFATNPDYYKALALDRINQLPVPPTVIVCSGGGFQCYWLLRETFHIRSTKDDAAHHVQSYIADIQKRWVAFVGGDPGAHDLRRILRLPGSRNYKKKYGPDGLPVTYVKFDYSLQYSLDELAALLPQPEPTPEPAPKPEGKTIPLQPHTYVGESVIDAYNETVRIEDALEAQRYTRQGDRYSRPGDPESKGVQILRDSNRSLHWSSNDPLYSEHARTPFDVLCVCEFDGDVKAAVREAAKRLGMDRPYVSIDHRPMLAVAQQWGREHSFEPFIDPALIGKTYRGDSTHTKLWDAFFHQLWKFNRLSFTAGKKRWAKWAGISPNAVLPAFQCLSFALEVTTTERGITVTLREDFRIAQIDPQLQGLTSRGQCTQIENNEYTPRKNTDPFLTGTSRTVKEQCNNAAIVAGGTLKEWLATVPKGFGETCLRVLDALGRHGEMDKSELAGTTGKKSGTLGRACKRLEDMGLIESEREHSRAPKVYHLADNVWEMVDELAPTLRTHNMSVEREDKQLRDNQRWLLREERKAKRDKNPEAAAEARTKYNKLAAVRLKHTIPVLYPHLSREEQIDLALADLPKQLHPAARQAIELAEAEERNRESWALVERMRELFNAGESKRSAVVMMEYAGYTRDEAWRAANVIWGVAA